MPLSPSRSPIFFSDFLGFNYYDLRRRNRFEISTRPVTVTADAKSKVYGDADPALTYQVTSGSLASGDAFTGALTRAAGENVGLYAITVGSLASSDGNSGGNYNLLFVGAGFTITKRPVTVTADPQSKVFGQADPALTYQVTSGSLASGDSFTGFLTRDPGEVVGEYDIKVGTLAINDGNGGANYTLTFVGGQLTVQTACTFNGFMSLVGGSNPAVAFWGGWKLWFAPACV